MRRVIIESPYAGDVEANVEYARRALRDSLDRGEAPMVSHLLYTQALDDADPVERERGIAAGLAWGAAADATVVYADRGISRGMLAGILRARDERRPVEVRMLDLDRPVQLDDYFVIDGITEYLTCKVEVTT